VSDLAVNSRYGVAVLNWELLPRYIALGLAGGIGLALRNRVKLGGLLCGCVAASFLFYILANAGTWLSSPEYAKSFAGFFQSQTTGLPGYAPAWNFLRNSVVSDLLFTLIFAGCMSLTRERTGPARFSESRAG